MVGHIPITMEERQRAEAILLGSLFLHPDAGTAIRDVLQVEDFCENRHRQIYEALMTVLETPELVTIDAVSTLLTEDELERMGGVLYLTSLQQHNQHI